MQRNNKNAIYLFVFIFFHFLTSIKSENSTVLNSEYPWLRLPPTPQLPFPDNGQYAQINNISIWYTIYGPKNGTPVLFLHGGVANSNYWGLQIQQLQRVTSIRSILRNTFSGQYKSIPGMSERYRHYELYYNATFHYLTASPDQLYPFLHEFIQREKFPLGSYHMRHFTWFDINFLQFFSSKSFIKQKTKILHMFFQQTRSRKFILFGDIFQKDPEIYANIYQQYSERILKIFIRISNKNLTNRLNTVFKYIPKSKWDIFLNGFDLPEKIF
ncbi:unnamed protein product [Rotaria sp. Silwood1]|nr:unnamed protein product [Rotaria sp. Silwood1]